MRNKTKNSPHSNDRLRRKRGFSLIELIAVIATMAILISVLAPNLLSRTEQARAQKDDSSMSEVVKAIESSLSNLNVYDEVLDLCVDNNISCYIDSESEADYLDYKYVTTSKDGVEQYTFSSNTRTANEVPYTAAGNMRGVTITFTPEQNGGEVIFDLENGIINKYTGGTKLLGESEYLYDAMRRFVGSKVIAGSNQYKYSEYTIFISVGNIGDSETLASDAFSIYGQWGGTNLTASNCTPGIADDRATGDDSGDDGEDEPSGGPSDPSCGHPNIVDSGNDVEATCVKEGYSGDKVCVDCGKITTYGSVIPINSNHKHIETKGAVEATCIKEGHTETKVCRACGKTLSGSAIPINPTNHKNIVVQNATATYPGDKVCLDCGKTVESGVGVAMAQAIFTNDGVLTFVKSTTVYSESDTYNGKTIVAAYTGFESSAYASQYSVPWYSNNEYITKVVFANEIKPNSTAYWFYGFKNCGSFDFAKLNTSEITDMSFMFYETGRNTETFELDLSNWNTSNVTNMVGMFYGSGKNATIWDVGNIGKWNTSKVVDMSYMFYGSGYEASTWNAGNLNTWNTSNVRDMSYMFANAGYSAKTFDIGDLSTWKTGNVSNMLRMFNYAGYNSDEFVIDLRGWETSKVVDMRYMFSRSGYRAKTWSVGDLSGWNTSSVTDMSNMFSYSGYNSIDWGVGDICEWDTANVTNMSGMFNNAGYNANGFVLDLSYWDTSNVADMNRMFYFCNAKKLDLKSWDTSKVADMTNMFDNAKMLERITLSENFSFKGNGNTSCVLPTQSPTYVPEADGKWYNVHTDVGYLPTEVPNNVEATYSSSTVYNGALTVTATGYTGIYDGQAHGITITCEQQGATITYSTSRDGTYSTDNIMYTDVGTYTVYYKVEKFGYIPEKGMKNIVINQADGSVKLSAYEGTFTYPTAGTFTVTENISGGALSVVSSNTDSAKVSISGSTITVTPDIIAGTSTITVTSAETRNYKEASVAYVATIKNGVLTVTANGYVGAYDGKAHGIAVTCQPSGATIVYKTSYDGEYSGTSPMFTNAGTYTVWYKVSKPGYITETGSRDVVINKAAGLVELSAYAGELTYPTDGSFTVTKNISDGKLSVTSSNNNVATASISGTRVTVTPGTTTGTTAVITVTSAETKNYLAASATYVVTVHPGTFTVTSHGYSGTYDGNAHGITVVSSPSGTISYSNSANGSYTTVNPAYTNAGTYTVYYKIEKPGFITATGSETVVINKAAGYVKLASTSGTYYYPTAGTFDVVENISGGSLSVSSSNNNIAKASISGTTVTVTPGTDVNKKVTITVTSAETPNYLSASATYTATVKPGVLDVTAKGYTGTYDKAAHKITVTCKQNDATITYSTDGVNYSATNPTFTNAGTYTVYYKVEKIGYTAVTGSEKVVINKANGSVELSVYTGALVYPTSETFTVTKNISGGALSVSSSNANIATANVNGTTVAVMPGTTAGTAIITVTAAETTNYKEASAQFSAVVDSGELIVHATGYSGTYDKNAHSISVTCSPSGATITYSTSQNGTYGVDNPTFTNAGTYTVYYKVEKPGYNTVTGSETVVINKAAGSVVLSASSGTFTYPNSGTFTVKENVSGGDLSVKSSNTNVADVSISGTTVTVAPDTTAGTVTITVTSAETTNYLSASATYKATIKNGALNVTAKAYSGTYDGKAHGITVTCTQSGATITYATSSGGTYSATNPTYTNAGKYTVYFKVEKAGYTTYTGSANISISKAAGSVKLSSNSGTHTYPTSGTFNVTENISGGELSVKSSNTNVATVSISDNKVTVVPGTTAGKATITVTSAETTNYKSASATYTATIDNGALNVTAKGYTGTYDKKAHGITVTCEPGGTTITYSTSENGTYEATNPTYTNAGTYTVWYKVEKTGYTTVKGSAKVVINKANGSVVLNPTSGTYTYPTSGTFAVKTNTSGGTLSVKSSNTSIATASIDGTTVTVVPGTTTGTATITVTSAATNNYKEASATYKATVNSGQLNVSASGYTGTYDSKAHGITVSCSTAGATITYATTSGGTYSSTNPTYTDAGTYTVYYKVEKTGYTTVTGSKTVVINKAAGSITLSPTSGKLTYPTSGTFSVTKNISNGTLSVVSTNANIATATVSGNTVTVKPGAAAGSATIIVTAAETTNYLAASANYTVTVDNGSLSVTATGYNGTYNKAAHGITVTCIPNDAKVTYSTSENGTYSTTNPTYTNAGTYTVYYKVEKAGYNTVTGSAKVVINKAAGSITLSANSGTFTYPTSGTFTVKENVSGGKLSVKSSDESVAKVSISGTTVTVTPGTKAGTATITVTSAATDNYNAVSVTYTATVKNGALNVSASGYTGTYDGKAHGITVTCDGATITYSTSQNGTYSATNPTYTNAGTYTVYYKVVKSGYTTVTGNKTVVINKANNTLTLSATSGTYTYPTSGTFTVTKNTSGGALSVTSSNTNVATASISGTTVTVKPGTTSGTATITVTSAATDNYNAASATYTATVKNGTLSVSASDYTGVYDGKAHGITVTCAGATITYSTSQNGTYSATNPTYTNVGTYTVYYKVVKAGYATVTGSKTVKITKANGSVVLDKTSETLASPATATVNVIENTSGGTLSVSTSNSSIATATISGTTVTVKSGTATGTATITVTSAATDNYNAASATYTVTVKNGTLTVTANGYTGIYDGKAHGITVTCTQSGATITYATSSGGTYSATNPTYTNVGTYTVYYKVEKTGYNTATGSKTVVITQRTLTSIGVTKEPITTSYLPGGNFNTSGMQVTATYNNGTTAIIPHGYTFLEYIEATGTQYIKTGVVGPARWNFDIQFTDTSTRQLMGYGGSGSEYWGASGYNGYYGLANWSYVNVKTGNRDFIVHNYGEDGAYYLNVNGVQGTVGVTDVTSKEYQIFNIGNAYWCKAKLYGCTVVQNGKIIREFVPARNSAGVVGLYDMVNGQFYTNAGSGTFKAGPVVLPAGYTTLEYIESTGTQYIDTGYVPNQGTRIDVVAMPLDIRDATYNVGFIPYGAGIDHNNTAFECYIHNSTYEINYGNSYEFVGSAVSNQITTITQNKNVATINNGTAKYSYTAPASTFTSPYTMTLFAINRGTRIVSGPMRMYSCQIYDNYVLVRNYVPCKNSSGTVGLYDLVEGKFYANSGTGSFTAGTAQNTNRAYPQYGYFVTNGTNLTAGQSSVTISYTENGVTKTTTQAIHAHTYTILGTVDQCRACACGQVGAHNIVDSGQGKGKCSYCGYEANYICINIARSASSTYSSVTFNGTKYTTAANVKCFVGSTIECKVSSGSIYLNGTKLVDESSADLKSYSFTITSNVHMEFASSTLYISDNHEIVNVYGGTDFVHQKCETCGIATSSVHNYTAVSTFDVCQSCDCGYDDITHEMIDKDGTTAMCRDCEYESSYVYINIASTSMYSGINGVKYKSDDTVKFAIGETIKFTTSDVLLGSGDVYLNGKDVGVSYEYKVKGDAHVEFVDRYYNGLFSGTYGCVYISDTHEIVDVVGGTSNAHTKCGTCGIATSSAHDCTSVSTYLVCQSCSCGYNDALHNMVDKDGSTTVCRDCGYEHAYLNIDISGSSSNASVTINGGTYTSASTVKCALGTEIFCKASTGTDSKITLNDTDVGSGGDGWFTSNIYSHYALNDMVIVLGGASGNESRIDLYDNNMGTIVFTLNGKTYYADGLVTWSQWLASDNNTDGYVIGPDQSFCDSNGTVFNIDSIINNGYNYRVGYTISLTGSATANTATVTVNGTTHTSAKKIFVLPGEQITISALDNVYVNGNPAGKSTVMTATGPLSIYITGSSGETSASGSAHVVTPQGVMTTPPHKIQYNTSGTFDPTGMIITHVHEDGTKEIITEYTYTPEKFESAATNQTVTISYNDKYGNSHSFQFGGINVTGCFAEGTLITLADGTQKPIEDITYNDELLVWDFYNGTYASSVPSLIESDAANVRRVLNLNFSDGTTVRVIDHHGFFDATENDFVFIDEFNAASYIGHEFVQTTEDFGSRYVELVDYEITLENVRYYTLLTAVHSNCYAERMLTLTPPPIGLDSWFDIFEICEGMKYDDKQIQSEIEKYGLYTYEDFDEYMTYDQFIAFNGPYLKILVGRGVLTYEQILEAINAFADIILSQR